MRLVFQLPAGNPSAVDAPRLVSSDASPTRPECAVTRLSTPARGHRDPDLWRRAASGRWQVASTAARSAVPGMAGPAGATVAPRCRADPRRARRRPGRGAGGFRTARIGSRDASTGLMPEQKLVVPACPRRASGHLWRFDRERSTTDCQADVCQACGLVRLTSYRTGQVGALCGFGGGAGVSTVSRGPRRSRGAPLGGAAAASRVGTSMVRARP